MGLFGIGRQKPAPAQQPAPAPMDPLGQKLCAGIATVNKSLEAAGPVLNALETGLVRLQSGFWSHGLDCKAGASLRNLISQNPGIDRTLESLLATCKMAQEITSFAKKRQPAGCEALLERLSTDANDFRARGEVLLGHLREEMRTGADDLMVTPSLREEFRPAGAAKELKTRLEVLQTVLAREAERSERYRQGTRDTDKVLAEVAALDAPSSEKAKRLGQLVLDLLDVVSAAREQTGQAPCMTTDKEVRRAQPAFGGKQRFDFEQLDLTLCSIQGGLDSLVLAATAGARAARDADDGILAQALEKVASEARWSADLGHKLIASALVVEQKKGASELEIEASGAAKDLLFFEHAYYDGECDDIRVMGLPAQRLEGMAPAVERALGLEQQAASGPVLLAPDLDSFVSELKQAEEAFAHANDPVVLAQQRAESEAQALNAALGEVVPLLRAYQSNEAAQPLAETTEKLAKSLRAAAETVARTPKETLQDPCSPVGAIARARHQELSEISAAALEPAARHYLERMSPDGAAGAAPENDRILAMARDAASSVAQIQVMLAPPAEFLFQQGLHDLRS